MSEYGSIWQQLALWLKWKLGINYYKVVNDQMVALFIQQDYIKIDCDKCGDEVCFIEFHADLNPDVKKAFKVFCRECLDK